MLQSRSHHEELPEVLRGQQSHQGPVSQHRAAQAALGIYSGKGGVQQFFSANRIELWLHHLGHKRALAAFCQRTEEIGAAEHPDDPALAEWNAQVQVQLGFTPRAGADPALRATLIPPRPASAGPAQLDLTPFYNGLLAEDLHPSSSGKASTGNNLVELPTGHQPFHGIPFDAFGNRGQYVKKLNTR